MNWPVKLTCAQFTELSAGGLGDAAVGRVRTDIARQLVTFLVIPTVSGTCKTEHQRHCQLLIMVMRMMRMEMFMITLLIVLK